MTSASKPPVSIGMPVYNGARYLRHALEALLSQDFRDFELIISDNASTDSTASICLEFAAQDSRVRYYRNEENIGASRNFDRVFELSSGEYFMWAAYDDLWAPSFLRECVAELNRNPAAVGCCTEVLLIDEDGNLYEPPDDSGPRTWDSRNMNPRQRAAALLSRTANYAIYGLLRADALRQTRPFENLLASDAVRLLELYLRGPFAKVPKPLFFYRVFPSQKVSEIIQRFDPSSSEQPFRRLYTPTISSLFRAIWRSEVGRASKAAITITALPSFCFRNGPMRSLIGAENVGQFRYSYRQRSLKGMFSAAPFCVLALPDKLFSARESNEQKLIAAYQSRAVLKFLRHLPMYMLLAPGKLARKETWGAVGRLFKKSQKSLIK